MNTYVSKSRNLFPSNLSKTNILSSSAYDCDTQLLNKKQTIILIRLANHNCVLILMKLAFRVASNISFALV